jgi:hypothetical protein
MACQWRLTLVSLYCPTIRPAHATNLRDVLPSNYWILHGGGLKQVSRGLLCVRGTKEAIITAGGLFPGSTPAFFFWFDRLVAQTLLVTAYPQECKLPLGKDRGMAAYPVPDGIMCYDHALSSRMASCVLQPRAQVTRPPQNKTSLKEELL